MAGNRLEVRVAVTSLVNTKKQLPAQINKKHDKIKSSGKTSFAKLSQHTYKDGQLLNED